MARIVLISPYLKGGQNAAKLAQRTRYVATRPGVELLVDERSTLPATKKVARCGCTREQVWKRIFCAAIVKDKAARLRGANDNFLITIPFFGSFVPLITVLFVAKGADTMPKRRANGEGNIRKR